MIRARARAALKAVRAWPPFNALATSTVSFALRRLGLRAPDFVAMHLIRVGEVRCALPDGRVVRFWSRGDDGVANVVFWRGWMGSERATAPLFYELARRARVTFDIGAHVGYYTVLAGAAAPNGQVHAFEPLPPVRARLENHVRLNGLTNVTVHSEALGGATVEADFFHLDGDMLPTSSSLSEAFMNDSVASWGPTRALARDKGLMHTRVRVTTVDELCQAHGIAQVDLVKIDTETTEPDVLRGMQRTLERDHPDIICEILFNQQAVEIEALLGPYGYRFFNLRPEGPSRRDKIVVATDAHERSISLNWLFATRDEPLGRHVTP